jgi:hypothetical protein
MNNRFDMMRLREHIEGRYRPDRISILDKTL